MGMYNILGYNNNLRWFAHVPTKLKTALGWRIDWLQVDGTTEEEGI